MCRYNVANVQAFSGRQCCEHNVIMERGARQDPPRTQQIETESEREVVRDERERERETEKRGREEARNRQRDRLTYTIFEV